MTMTLRLVSLTAFLTVVLGGAASGADGDPAADDSAAGWVLTTADFRSTGVVFKAIDPSGIKVADAGQGADRVVGMDDFLQLERATPAAPATTGQQGRFVLHLLGGDQVAGEPAAIRGEQLAWTNAAAGELLVPMSRAVALTKPGQQPPERRPTEDVVTLANGDAVRGIIAGIEGGKISVQRADSPDPLAVPIESVQSVQFAAAAGAGGGAAGKEAKGFRLRLADGSSLPAASLALAGGKLSADLGDGKPRPFDLPRVVAIEQVNGPASWLTGRQPVESVYVPYFGTGKDFPARMSQSAGGGRDLHYGGKAFRVQYAVDERLTHADMAVRVKLDDRIVHENAHARAGTLSPVIVADLGGAKRLTLEVDYGGGTDVQDRLVWLDPALLRRKPAEEPAPVPATFPASAPAPAKPD